MEQWNKKHQIDARGCLWEHRQQSWHPTPAANMACGIVLTINLCSLPPFFNEQQVKSIKPLELPHLEAQKGLDLWNCENKINF